MCGVPEMKQFTIGCALISALMAGSVVAADEQSAPSKNPTLLTDEQMDQVVAGDTVTYLGNNLKLVCTTAGVCTWYSGNDKVMNKPVH